VNIRDLTYDFGLADGAASLAKYYLFFLYVSFSNLLSLEDNAVQYTAAMDISF
jgi:hypothetical protein